MNQIAHLIPPRLVALAFLLTWPFIAHSAFAEVDRSQFPHKLTVVEHITNSATGQLETIAYSRDTANLDECRAKESEYLSYKKIPVIAGSANAVLTHKTWCDWIPFTRFIVMPQQFQ